ncbi:YdeI/OmpD-associated family protein [Motilimonas cestriensis]|uniref:YdeI/OmpD-associated family protein n=1 Tax=Motilimonas cestriensis TaxID=2742685 RepID=UPI003DA32DC8
MNSKISGGLVHDMPADLAEALTEKDVVNLWEALTPIGRNEFICWVDDAKQQQTRVKRIGRTVDELLEGKKRPCCWAGCIHRTDKKPSKWQQDVLIDKKLTMRKGGS